MTTSIFKHPNFGQIRTAGTTDNPLFCLVDVCNALKLDSGQVMKRLSDGVVTIHPTPDSLGRVRNTNFVNEDGLYDVILDSRKEEAKTFRKWITSEVLPSIRKHGGYLTPQKMEEALLNPDTIIQLATALKQEQEKRLRLQATVEEQQPKVVFANALITSQTSCLIGELAKLITQNGCNIGQNRLFEWMRKNGYIGKRGENRNIPNQIYVEQGLFELKKGVRSGNDGVMHTTITTKVTGKGQAYFINKFLNSNNL